MSKLLSANLLRLRKNMCFLAGIIIMIAIGIYLPVNSYLQIEKYSVSANLDNCLFNGSILIPVILSVFCSLFLGTEYSDGTVRNKIIVGHRRIDIYFANLVTNFLAGLLLVVVYFAAILIVGIPLLGFLKSEGIEILLCFAVFLGLLCAFTAVFTMVGMVIANKASGAVICVLGVFLLLLAATFIQSRLIEPKYYTNIQYSINEEGGGTKGEETRERNPFYIEGTKRKAFQFLNDFLPGGQLLQCQGVPVSKPLLLIGYSIVIFIISTSAGIILFQRKNIN